MFASHISNTLRTLSQQRRLLTTPRVLVTGSLGQLGSTIVSHLRQKYGASQVIASDIKPPTQQQLALGPFVYADVLDYPLLDQIVRDHGITQLVHFSAVLSAAGEQNPSLGLKVNVTGFQNVLDLAKQHNLRLLSPSTIGAFGPTTPKDDTPELTVMRPNTIYGITKVHMELMGEYYQQKYGVDFRSLRYPGIISADSPPGGGTTDYAIDIFHGALKDNQYECFLDADCRLPMAYIDDCIEGTTRLLEAPQETLSQRVYNVHACDFTPHELAEQIREQYSSDFQIRYKPDFRQQIADTWPRTLVDMGARRDWGWNPKYGTRDIARIMLEKLKPTYSTAEAEIPSADAVSA